MKIEALRPPQQPKSRWTLEFEDGKCLRILAAVVADEGLYAGKELTESELAHLFEAAGEASAKDRAVRIISAADVSKRDLERRLTEKGETPAHAQAAVAWLTEMHLLDDSRVAAQLVARGVSRGYGKNRIKQMLYEKKIPKEYWEAALAQVPEMDDEIDRFLQQKLRGTDPDRKELNRVVAALVRRGHNWSDIHAALERYREGLSDGLEAD